MRQPLHVIAMSLLLGVGTTACLPALLGECRRDSDCDDDEECEDLRCEPVDDDTADDIDPGNNDDNVQEAECIEPEDCPNIACECSSGAPVNTRDCNNGLCEIASETCPDSCATFGTTWTGRVIGGGTTTPDDDTPPVDGEETESCDPSLFTANICGTCAVDDCCENATACERDADCQTLTLCVVNCRNCVNGCGSETFCEDSCKNLSTVAAARLYDPYSDCMDDFCSSSCVP